jgi:hypothetical protein
MLTLFGGATLFGNAQRQTVDLYFFAGQSNGLSGYTGTKDGDTYPADSTRYLTQMVNSYIFNPYWDTAYYETIFSSIPRWKPVLIGKNTGGVNADVNYFGCETSFAYWNAPVYILKINGNNQSITAYTDASYWPMIEKNIVRAFTQARQQKKILNLKGFIWNQGDTDGIGESGANAYRVQLDTLFKKFNRVYARMCVKYSMPNNIKTYKKILVQCRSGVTYLSTVEAAKQDFVADSLNAIYWYSTEYTFRSDNLHYQSVKHLLFGIDLYNYFKNGALPTFAPSNLTTTLDGSDIDLAWDDNSTNEDGFKIERSLTGTSNWAVVHTTTADVEVWTNSGLDATTQYFYRARAYKGTIYSQYSNIDSETTPGSYPSVLEDGNTVAWYIADETSTITKDGSNFVSRWNDFLGSGHDLIQATDGKKPVWSSSGVFFNETDNDNYLATANFTFNQPVFIYIVARKNGWTASGYWFDGSTGDAMMIYNHTTLPGMKAYAGSLSTQNDNLDANTWGIVRVLFNGANSKLIVNATTPTTGDFGSQNMGGIILGMRSGGTAGVNSIQFKELIFRKAADGSTDETAIYNYLKAKYGL